jgi:hypothetical protein
MRLWIGAPTALLLAMAFAASASARGDVDVSVLSSRADQVSGGDALIRVDTRRPVRVLLNGADVTDAFERSGDALVGLVDGLRLGSNKLRVKDGRRTVARKRLVNHPIEGPIFSGPHQVPFVCKTIQAGLGEPLVDNQAGEGFRVLNPDGSTAGFSRDCSTTTRVDYMYRPKGTTGNLQPLPPGGVPADQVEQTTTLDGRTVPFIVRRERGTINRFIYSLAMLADPAAPETDASRWNRRLVYFFDGGVAIGRNQGTPGGSAVNPDLLGLGYAIAHSSGTRASVHYNLVLGGETALMTKERFIERYGVPLYTTGVGGSGGAIQQYVYGQNHRGLLDGGIPIVSYPDMVTQTIHVGDCELLEHYMDVTDATNSKWQNWANRRWLIGLNSSATVPNPYRGGLPGSTECVAGWRGLTPLAMNPLFGTAGAGTERMDPAVMAGVHWTHWEDVRNVYGVGSDGYARQTWDNIGVQYGLQALVDGKITPDEFLKLNATVGSWKDPGEMVQEGAPFLPGTFDPWSSRNMRLSADGGATPAPRRSGSIPAMNAAYEKGLYFDGEIDIPLIDMRDYRELQLDMHNSHQSFATRRRMLDADGNASNQVIWFSGFQGDRTLDAFKVMDEWQANIRAKPWRSVAANKPADATDRCFTAAGTEIARGPHVWDGILDDGPDGPCTAEFPLFSTSRIVAGGPLRGGVYKCALQPVDRAIARGLYGSWHPSAAERARLRQIFPTGVCDYGKPDQGRPRHGHH